MTATHVIVSLLGEVALLLWGIHMVGSGVQRAFGSSLRQALAVGLSNRLRAFGAGVAVTALLQSSTATALMVSSFLAEGAVGLTPALAVMLGANVGTALIVQVVSFDISLVFPLLILGGLVAYRTGRRGTVRDIGSAVIGLGLMLLALHLLIETMRPVEQYRAVHELLHALTRDPLINIVLAAGLAWASHSSVAAMLFIMSLAGAGAVTEEAALAMVLGANLGSAINPFAGALGKGPARLRLPLANLANRLAGVLVALPLLPFAAAGLAALGEPPARIAADFHLIFNLATALVAIGPLPAIARLLRRALPEKVQALDPGMPQYLDRSAFATPAVALSNAAREALRLADMVEAMLRGSQEAFHRDDRDRIAEVSRMDDGLDRLYGAVQRYLGAISQEALGDDDARRLAEIMALTINLEHIGDIVDKNLMELAAKRIRQQLKLPPDAIAAVDEMHSRLLDHLQLAVAVFMYGDVQAARRLVAEKEQFRDIERAATRRHFDHVRAGGPGEVEMSTLQLDITRDLKRIEAHVAATAYGLLEQSGQLRTSRLRF